MRGDRRGRHAEGASPTWLPVPQERGHDPAEQIVRDVLRMVRDDIGPVAAFKQAIVVDRLPKTRSGKILRATMAKIADGEEYKTPATIDDPAVLAEITAALRDLPRD